MMNPAHYWFLKSSVKIRVSHSNGVDGVSILDHRVSCHDSPPLHHHRTEDEIFHFLEGRFRFRLQDREHAAGPGDVLLVPKGTPHTCLAESPDGGRFLTVTARGDFERFVRDFGRPAEHHGLPDPAPAPTPEAMRSLVEAASRYGIEIIGPPLAVAASGT